MYEALVIVTYQNYSLKLFKFQGPQYISSEEIYKFLQQTQKQMVRYTILDPQEDIISVAITKD